MAENKTFRLHPKAIDDLESLYSYSTHQFGAQKTEDYILAIETSIQHLARNPLISRQCDYIRRGLRAFSVGSHIVFFKITDYGIAVIRVLHQSMDFVRHL